MILAEVGALEITRKHIKKIPRKPYFFLPIRCNDALHTNQNVDEIIFSCPS